MKISSLTDPPLNLRLYNNCVGWWDKNEMESLLPIAMVFYLFLTHELEKHQSATGLVCNPLVKY